MSPHDVLGDIASEVMFDGVLCCVPATQHATVGFEVSFLVSPLRAPSVPEGAESGSTDSGWCKLL